jgi:hypothetical protein
MNSFFKSLIFILSISLILASPGKSQIRIGNEFFTNTVAAVYKQGIELINAKYRKIPDQRIELSILSLNLTLATNSMELVPIVYDPSSLKITLTDDSKLIVSLGKIH